jgi:O-acetyl-ADP-ribose deacetylase (regulator of RNase III)
MIWGDIAAMETDAVVNAAYPTLRGGADGAHGAICDAAGREALEAALAAIGWCDVGDAVVTPGFGLTARHIIHAVGPQWRGGAYGERELLGQTYRRALALAEDLHVQSLAFTLLSAGSFGFPTDVALDVAVAEIGAYLRAHEGLEVTLVLDGSGPRRLPDPLHGRLSEYLHARYAEDAPEVPLRPVGAQRGGAGEPFCCGTADRRAEDTLAAHVKHLPPDRPMARDAAPQPADARARHVAEPEESPRPLKTSRRAGTGCLLLAIPRVLGTLLFWLVAGVLFAVTWPLRALWRLLRGKGAGTDSDARMDLYTAQMPAPDEWREDILPAHEGEEEPPAHSDAFAPEEAVFVGSDLPPDAKATAAPEEAPFQSIAVPPWLSPFGSKMPPDAEETAAPEGAADMGRNAPPRVASFLQSRGFYGAPERYADRDMLAPMSAPATPPEGAEADLREAASLAERQRSDWEWALERQREQRMRADVAERRVADAARARTLQDAVAHLGDTFSQAVLHRIDLRGLRDVDVYKRANLTRQLFSKLRSDPHYQPSKQTAVALCVALELTLDDALDLLARAGYTLAACNKADLIAAYFIEHGIYDVFQLNEALFAFAQPCLGA